ncbi:MAG: hypothetical protein HRT88_24125, partial [Lentisphaeraceae bacterium]|nr:hypothetical protein [Lentisphaeraceae bacterium]
TILNQSLDHKDTKAMSIELKKMLAQADQIILTAKGREKKAIDYLRKSLVKLLKKKTYKESSLKKIFSKKTAGKFTKFTEAYDADTIEKNIRQKILAKPGEDYHKSLIRENEYVSATQCQSCHEEHFEQWSRSQHAYAQLSPVYMAMQNTINILTSGTNGDFCIRCHNQVGMNKGEPTYMSNLNRHPASKEGVTCVVCHRMSASASGEQLEYGKVSGRIALDKGGLTAKVFGPGRLAENETPDDVAALIKSLTEAGGDKATIHQQLVKTPQIQTSAFCATCHDVNLFNGFRLEEAFSEFKNSHAAFNGISCQDCHMGVDQGVVRLDANGEVSKENYRFGLISNKSTKNKKMTDHTFSGPDHTIIHPGLFPTSSKLVKMATDREWLGFDFAAGWGSNIWENKYKMSTELDENLSIKNKVPSRWLYRKDREEARLLILEQFERLSVARHERLNVLRHAYKLVEPSGEHKQSVISITSKDLKNGLQFSVGVKNATGGHNAPTGFIAERLVWVETSVYKMNDHM